MINKIENIVIIGAGNVATHLAKSLSTLVNIKGILSKNNENAKQLATDLHCLHIQSMDLIPTCDLVLICTNDDAIKSIEQLLHPKFNVAYTSGSVEIDTTSKRENYGVFYPLQTFSKDKELNIKNIPFFIEATNKEFSENLFNLAIKLSDNVSFANSTERKKLHLSAVFVNNFTNHLAFLARDFIEKNELNWEYLKPLIEETTNKILSSNPYDAQTGPARRNDQLIMNEHLHLLKDNSKDIYKAISKSIVKTYN